MKNVRVIIANDQTLVSASIRCFLKNSLGMEVLASVRLGPRARGIIARKKPELLFLYLGERSYEGLEKTQRLLKAFPKLPSVLLSVNSSKEYVAKALRTGVNAIFPTTAQPKEVQQAIRAALRGGSFLSVKLPKPARELTGKTAFERLTARQRSVLKLMAEGNKIGRAHV